jgi:hypothetical protein
MKRKFEFEIFKTNMEKLNKIYEDYENENWYLMETNKIQELKTKRNLKYKEWINTDFKDWKKQLRKYELDIIDLKIKKEKLKALKN